MKRNAGQMFGGGGRAAAKTQAWIACRQHYLQSCTGATSFAAYALMAQVSQERHSHRHPYLYIIVRTRFGDWSMADQLHRA